MATVSAETIRKLNEFLESLPEDAKGKCALCNQTLTHIVKQAEAQTGAGTRTVTRMLAEKMNEDAAPQDQVTAEGLLNRARETAGEKHRSIVSNGHNEPTAQDDNENSGYTGHISTDEVAGMVADIVKEKRVSQRRAEKEVADRTGKNLSTIRMAVTRSKAQNNTEPLDSATVYTEVEKLIREGMTTKEAAQAYGAKIGRKAREIRDIHKYERHRVTYPYTISTAVQFVRLAISQLERIDKTEDGWEQALEEVERWIENFRRM